MSRAVFWFTILFAIASMGLSVHSQTEPPVTAIVRKALTEGRPGWRYISMICTCAPTISGEVAHTIGEWVQEGAKAGRRSVRLDILEVRSKEEAAAWVGDQRRRVHAENGDVEIGGDAFAGKDSDGIELIVSRVGRYVVTVRGRRADDVAYYAKYVVTQLPGS